MAVSSKMNKSGVPSEDAECELFHLWLCARNIPHTHIPNESRSSKKDAVIRGAKLRKMGQSKGYWDYDIYLPIKGITGRTDAYQLIKIEMKAQKNGSVSTEQKDWGKIYEKAGIPCAVCKGFDKATNFVLKVAEEISPELADELVGNVF